MVGLVGVSSPEGRPPLGLQEPVLGTESPLYLADVAPPMSAHDCGARHVCWGGPAQPIGLNVDTVPPSQLVLAGSHAQTVHPRVSVTAL